MERHLSARAYLVPSWGVILLALLAMNSTLLAIVCTIDRLQAKRDSAAARAIIARATFLIDSIQHGPYILSPRDSLRRRYVP